MKNQPNEIDLAELKRTVDAIFEHLLNDVGVKKVTIPNDTDFYWEVPSDELYSVSQAQPKLDTGRLTDDWEFLSPILKDNRQAVGLMFTHIAPLLRYIGQKESR
ncbi:MAG: hypothetical protein Q8T11_03310 [Elusimicrobiota bacterium]|nr:hypothetical protein [Elusimicrobiota bacterium]